MMLRKVMVMGVGLLLASTALAQQNNWQKLDLQGKVKQVESTTYFLFANGEKKLDSSTLYRFNPQGFYTELIFRDEKGVAWGWSRFDYDQEGRISKDTELDDRQQITEVISYHYRRDKQHEFVTLTDQKQHLYQKEENSYDANGNVLESKRFDASGKLIAHDRSSYDAKGLLLRATTPLSDRFSDTQYQRDAAGRVKAVLSVSSAGKVISQMEFTLNQQGRKTAYITRNPETQRIEGQGVYTLDAVGNVIKVVNTSKSGQKMTEYRYSYY